jgi:predicted phage-related endonuclease
LETTRNVAVPTIVEKAMTELHEIKREIEVLSEQRSELWTRLSQGFDATVSTDLKEIDARLDRLWDEHRAVKARLRFGDREKIIKRARTEERLLRAA